MKVLKYFIILVLSFIALFLTLTTFSGVKTNYKCEGELITDTDKQPLTAYLEMDEYRWWVGLWSDSDGSLWVEIPDDTVYSFTDLSDTGKLISFYETYPTKKIKGDFSKLSKSITFETMKGVFNGTCNIIN